jgi:glycine/D-amino acid oxidase-like deaminating enzyme
VAEPPRSLWWDTLPAPVTRRAALGADEVADVAIVGGGFTGLWTARELLVREPALRVVVLEAETCGFGASGRNGGWASALYPLSHAQVAARHGLEAASNLRAALRRAVVELGEAAGEEGVDCDFARGGSLTFARNEVQRARLLAEVDEARAGGVGEADLAWLDAAAATERAALAGAVGATFTPHCARLQPARLVRGLADAVERRGATIFEGTAVREITPGRARADGGSVFAQFVLRATEAYSPSLEGHGREVVPLYSLMVASEPQPPGFWDEVGLRDAETFADDRHVIIYGQRTADGRFAFGGRGAPYHYGSSVHASFDDDARVFRLLGATLRELFPALEGEMTHAWGGPLAMPRDHSPYVRLDRSSGLGVAGGYTGDGVVLSRVAACALADLVTAPGRPSEHTTLPFVNRASRDWEREPLRWAGINAGLALAARADRDEAAGKQSRAARLLERLLG